MFATSARCSCGTASYGYRAGVACIYSEPLRIRVHPQRCAPQFTSAAAGRLEFPPIPPDVLCQIDQKKPLANSVKLYQRHFSVSSGAYNWPSTPKEDINYGPEQISKFGHSPPFKLSQFLVDWATALKPNKSVIYTKSSHECSLPCIHVYPDNVKITFNSPNPSLAQIQQFQSEWMSCDHSPQPLDFITIEPLPSNSVHIYICSHMQRDHRCGIIGNLLISSMRTYLSSLETRSKCGKLNIQVMGCSHVGGHKYAGNVVIYRPQWKQGVWYGRVQPNDIPEIIEKTVLEEKVLARFWRGGLPNGRWDPKEHITADEAERRALDEVEEAQCACAK